ncbi:DUF3617 domain-containing protein [Inhella sp.]|uniref:DUF3617 domain-containing protein n=1 Tax=Inhella sp. TaxID=1921806 RepID=UPI0035B3ABB6
MKRLVLLSLAGLLLNAGAEPMKPGLWELRMAYSADGGKTWPAPEAPRLECLLPEQVQRHNSHVRRSLQHFGCRLSKLQAVEGKGEGLAACWPQGQPREFALRTQLSAERLQIDLQTQAGSGGAPLHARLNGQRARDCTAQEARITSTRLTLEADDASGGAY